jgi:RNA polymerase sigma-70 factor (ECF subfamily)
MEVACNDSHEADLQRIVGRIADGDRSAEGDLVNRFQRGITLLARQHARPNEHRIPDVVQTVLINAIERLRGGTLRDATALPAYLRTCVINEVTAMYRAKSTTSSDAMSAADARQLELSTTDTPESRAAQAQTLRNVLRAIDSLAVPRDRELLIRFYVREESRDDICSALGIDESHFRRVLFRARERLQDLLGAAA